MIIIILLQQLQLAISMPSHDLVLASKHLEIYRIKKKKELAALQFHMST